MKNKLYVFSGVSGSGKSTIVNSLSDNQIVSFTTRNSRPGEINGKDYHFITEEKFNYLLNNDGLIEYTTYGDNHYGVDRVEFESKLQCGDTFFIADNNGAKQIKKVYDNTVSIFIYCDKEDCEKNMLHRGDSGEDVQKRLSTYNEEIDNLVYYDHVVVNRHNELEDTIQTVKDIIHGGF